VFPSARTPTLVTVIYHRSGIPVNSTLLTHFISKILCDSWRFDLHPSGPHTSSELSFDFHRVTLPPQGVPLRCAFTPKLSRIEAEALIGLRITPAGLRAIEPPGITAEGKPHIETIAPSTAASISASSNTTKGAFPPPAIVGIDDWAWRRNHRYGTLICDLERHATIALLPDREPATAEAGLAQQSQIYVVTRDRGGGYAFAAQRALPHVVQVADRWHLMENLALSVDGPPQVDHSAVDFQIGHVV
jgi:Transposase